MIGLCNDPEGPEQGAEQDPVRADQAAGDLFRAAALIGVPLFFLAKSALGTTTAALCMILVMLIVQNAVWNIVTINRAIGRSTWYFVDEFHLLLKEEQTAAYSAEIWKRFRKWGGVPTGATQNPKDLLSSPEIENILENSDFIYMLNQAAGDRKILAERLNISRSSLPM